MFWFKKKKDSGSGSENSWSGKKSRIQLNPGTQPGAIDGYGISVLPFTRYLLRFCQWLIWPVVKSKPFLPLTFLIKGQCHEISDFIFFSMNQFLPCPWVYHQGRFEFVRKFAEIFAAQGAQPGNRWQMKKNISIRKVFIILFGHLWIVIVELTYR
jgi:hypothetical protein